MWVFGRTNSSHSANLNNEIGPEIGNSGATTRALQGASTSHFRRVTAAPYIRRNATRRRGSGRTSRTPNTPSCDLILLRGPRDAKVPHQRSKLSLMGNGHMVSAVQFSKGMNEAQVLATIAEAFCGNTTQRP